MKRTFAISDIHGGFKALKQVLERAEVTENDKLIFLRNHFDFKGNILLRFIQNDKI